MHIVDESSLNSAALHFKHPYRLFSIMQLFTSTYELKYLNLSLIII